MKYKVILVLGLFVFSFQGLKAQMKIADNNNQDINASAILDLESDSLGLLLPRVALTNVYATDPLLAPLTAGMVVYSTGGSLSDGAYVWNGSQWVSLTNTGGGGGSSKTNYVLVESLSDFPTPSGGIISLSDNYVYEINGSVNIGSNTIQMGNNVALYGDSKESDILQYDGSGNMIQSADKTFNIRNLTLKASNSVSKVLSVTGSTSIVQLSEIIFNNCHELGTFDGGDILIVNDNLMDNCANGFELVGSFNQFIFNDNVTRNNSDILVSIPTGTFDYIMIKSNYFEVGSGLTALNISTSANITEGFFSNNFFTGNGTYLTGINYYDPDWTFNGNVGIKDSKAYGYIRFSQNNTATHIFSKYPSVYKANGSNYESTGIRFDVSGDNRLVYTGTKTIEVSYILDAGVQTNNSTENVRIAVYKNSNTSLNEAEARTNNSNQPYAIGLNGRTTLSTGDYLEVWVSDVTSTANVTVYDMQFSVREN